MFINIYSYYISHFKITRNPFFSPLLCVCSQSVVASWLKNRNNLDDANDVLLPLFDRYIPPLLDANKKFNKITPIPEISLIHMTCHLLDCLLTPENVPKNSPKDWYEIYFIFAAIWGFGSSFYEDQQIDWRMEFSRFWRMEFSSEYQSVQFPENSCVFDYYIDQNTKQFKLWEEMVPTYEIDTDIPLQVGYYTSTTFL